MDRIERIEKMEARLRHAEEVLGRFGTALEEYEAVQEEIRELDDYYGSETWYRDLAEDEAGRLPKELLRGVLSEDGIYDLLTENDRLRKRMAEIADESAGRQVKNEE